MKDFFGKVHHCITTLDCGGVFAENNFSGQHSASKSEHAFIIKEWLVKNYSFHHFCDIGGSIGTLALMMAQLGKDAYVVDGCEKGWKDGKTGVARDHYAVFDMSRPIQDLLPRHCFDMTTSFEVTEHVPRENLDGFIKNLAWLAPIHVCSLHVDGAECDNHYNVRPLEWWVEKFAEHGAVVKEIGLNVPTFGTSQMVEAKFS